MGNIVARPETGKLFFDFRYRNKRCREQTALDDTPANRRKREGYARGRQWVKQPKDVVRTLRRSRVR